MSIVIPFLGRIASRPNSADIAAKSPGAHETSRLSKFERDAAVLQGTLPSGSEELALIHEYRLSSWLTGPGR
jgi:hypothetical protein